MASSNVPLVAGGVSLNRDRVRNVFTGDDSVLIPSGQTDRSIRKKFEELAAGIELECDQLIHPARNTGIRQSGHLIAGDAVRTPEQIQRSAARDVRRLAGTTVWNAVAINPAWAKCARQGRTYQVPLLHVGGNAPPIVQREVPKPARQRAWQIRG